MQVLDYGGYLERAARLFGDRVAVVCGSQRRTWSDVHRRADGLAAGLTALGLQPGDRVADVRANDIDSVVVDFAIALAGLVRVPLTARLTPPEIARMVAGVRCRAVITTSDQAYAVDRIRAESRDVEFVIADGLPGALEIDEVSRERRGRRPVVAPDAMLNIRYTGGTTGLPKAVMAQQATQIGYVTMMLLDLCDIGHDDLVLQTQPYSHGGGNYSLPCAMRGGAIMLQERFDVDAVLDAVESDGVTMMKIVPTVLYRLVEAQRRRPRDLGTLRLIMYGAAPMQEHLIREAMDVFGCGFAQTYGQAEAQTTISCLNARDHERERREPSDRIRSVGRPYSLTDVAILGPDDVPLAAGEMGEVAIRGMITADGYWDDPVMTAEVFRDGWVRSGDLGTLSADGYLYLVGRASDMVITGGFNVYPAEVEQVLVALPGVAAAAVTAVPDPEWGERVVAAVVRADGPPDGAGLTKEQVSEGARAGLAGYKCPKEIRFVDQLPLNVNGKVDRAATRELFRQPVTATSGESA
jgi:acyl-CoA synthetase (AMP-forming)/AMP-acid ligase II